MNSSKPVFVTKPFLPPLQELVPLLEGIWERRVLTNAGPLHQRLEAELATFLGVPYISLFSNGTIALITAIQALGFGEGEVITTPYSFVATAHSILWNRLTPVFVDIHPETLNIDPRKIEEAITPRTKAILPVHCYGNPCDVEAIRQIAEEHRLKVVYDAAHAFAVKDSQGSLLRHGDFSILSFHGTKVYNTFEGGAIISHSQEAKRHIDQLKNFGIVDELNIDQHGTNGKMSEFNAAVGLLQLAHLQEAIERRKAVDAAYRRLLSGIPGIHCLPLPEETEPNYSYFPILVGEQFGCSRDDLYARMQKQGIFPRRYFYPLISQFPMYRDLPTASSAHLPVATRIAEQVLCLPIFPDLLTETVEEIAALIRG